MSSIRFDRDAEGIVTLVLDAPGVEAEMAGAGVLRFASPERAVNALASGA